MQQSCGAVLGCIAVLCSAGSSSHSPWEASRVSQGKVGFGERRAQCRLWGGTGVLWSSRIGPWLLDSTLWHDPAGPGAPCLLAEMLKARAKLAVGSWSAAGKAQLVADMHFIFQLATLLGEGAASP